MVICCVHRLLHTSYHVDPCGGRGGVLICWCSDVVQEAGRSFVREQDARKPYSNVTQLLSRLSSSSVIPQGGWNPGTVRSGSKCLASHALLVASWWRRRRMFHREECVTALCPCDWVSLKMKMLFVPDSWRELVLSCIGAAVFLR